MTYPKRTYKKKAYTKRSSTGWDKASMALATAGTALTLARGIKSLLNVETKWHDQSASTVNIATSFSLFAGASIDLAQGDTANTRDGQSIKLKSYLLNYKISNLSNVKQTSQFRVVGIYCPVVNGNAASYNTQIFEANGNFQTFFNMDTTGYQVIYDKTHQLSGGASTGTNGGSPNEAYHHFVYRPKNVHIRWASDDTTGSDSNLEKGLIRFFIMTSAFTTGQPHLDWRSRTKFIDN